MERMNGRDTGRWAADRLEHDLKALEKSATVRLAATMGSLIECGPSELCGDVLAQERTRNIDFIPVRQDGHLVGVLARADAEVNLRRTVNEAMDRLNSAMFASAGDPLIDVVEAMVLDGDPRFRLVLEGGRVTGILTLSDMQKLPVSVMIFARLAHFESLLTEVLRQTLTQEAYLSALAPGQRKQCEENLDKLRKGDQEIDIFQASYLSHKLRVAYRNKLLAGDEGASESRAEACRSLRNDIAHQNGYAETREKALATLRMLGELREWIDTLTCVREGRA